MNNFKIGDKVVRVAGTHNGMVSGDTDIVVGLRDQYGVYLANFNDNYLKVRSHYTANLELADEELPPVPDSVRYNEGIETSTLEIAVLPPDMYYDSRLRINIGPYVYQMTATCLEPDEALQLAHDITRMALKMKREQEKD